MNKQVLRILEIYIYDIIHKYETLNVNKVKSKENTSSFKALRAKQT